MEIKKIQKMRDDDNNNDNSYGNTGKKSKNTFIMATVALTRINTFTTHSFK